MKYMFEDDMLLVYRLCIVHNILFIGCEKMCLITFIFYYGTNLFLYQMDL